MSFNFTPARKLMLCAATAASFAAAAPLTAVHAQSAYPYGYQTGPDNEITVYGSRRQERDSATGAPIENVEASRVVYYGDLDLNSREGAHALRMRVARAANAACDDLDAMYPISTSDSPPCRRTAYRDAMGQTPVGSYGDAPYGYDQ
jgi:UrcA family protein